MFNDGLPLGIFRSDEICEFPRIHELRQETVAPKALLHVRQCDSGDDGFIQLFYDLIGQLGGAGKRKPGVVQKLRVAELRESRPIGKIRYSFGRSDGDTEQCRKPEVEESVDVENGT